MIATQKKKVGKIAPKKFIAKLRKENGAFLVWIAFLSCSCFFAWSSVSQEFLLMVFIELNARNLLVILINHYLELFFFNLLEKYLYLPSETQVRFFPS
mgnify:CR=1 FL=1